MRELFKIIIGYGLMIFYAICLIGGIIIGIKNYYSKNPQKGNNIMETIYATKDDIDKVVTRINKLDKETAIDNARQDERIKKNKEDIGDVKDDIKEIKEDNKAQKNMMIGIAASTILTLIGMVVQLLT